MGEWVTSSRGADNVRSTQHSFGDHEKINLSRPRYSGDLRTKDEMNARQKACDIEREIKKKKHENKREKEEKSLP
jgi:predicted GIY-YIG superfamily endonuclease